LIDDLDPAAIGAHDLAVAGRLRRVTDTSIPRSSSAGALVIIASIGRFFVLV
jgi:hypothetical protein